MKKNKFIIFSLVLCICLLTIVPLSSFAVQVKSSNGEIASSVEAESENPAPPLSADQIEEGTYNITVTSSSSMFRVTDCQLTVMDGQMTANMTLGGTAYLKLYMGTDAEAASAPEADCIPYTENTDGTYSYTVPVEALNKEIDCAAFSGRSNQWFPRTLVFESSSLPEGIADTSAGAAESVQSAEENESAVSATGENGASPNEKQIYKKAADAESSQIHYAPVSLADGNYMIPVTLSGGSGKASIDSPTEMTVKNNCATARIQWSSPHYDYMVVDGLLYEPVNQDGNSVFEIPVTEFGGMTVIADTTAMSQPYEIEYTLDFDSDQAERLGISTQIKVILMLVIILAVILIGFIISRLRSGKNKYNSETAEAELAGQTSAEPVSKNKREQS